MALACDTVLCALRSSWSGPVRPSHVGRTWGSSSYDPSSDRTRCRTSRKRTVFRRGGNAGYTGKGVDVALIDTGVSPVTGPERDGQDHQRARPLARVAGAQACANLDTYGHGTFMAGLIAGRLDGALAAPPSLSRRGAGLADRLGQGRHADGGVDVCQVIAAIDWVVAAPVRQRVNIRVLNLSYGTNSTQPYMVDPLAFAAEQAWKAGIVVVAAAGNTGTRSAGPRARGSRATTRT